jgi:ferredoxin
MPAVVDRDRCQVCEDCQDSCPIDAIHIVEGKAQVDAEDCTDCQACVDACIEQAISMVD